MDKSCHWRYISSNDLWMYFGYQMQSFHCDCRHVHYFINIIQVLHNYFRIIWTEKFTFSMLVSGLLDWVSYLYVTLLIKDHPSDSHAAQFLWTSYLLCYWAMYSPASIWEQTLNIYCLSYDLFHLHLSQTMVDVILSTDNYSVYSRTNGWTYVFPGQRWGLFFSIIISKPNCYFICEDGVQVMEDVRRSLVCQRYTLLRERSFLIGQVQCPQKNSRSL